ncbi:tctex1 domain-containing protein 1-like [Cimex lectularius]|uniref:Dynein light chain n=1 Tax=Cimex lectularius TaxID=79782 RepID=A0A8I6RM38_CIMLE|nr:tctex1 domain-containing protein 1-like [Cimex lectularius]
MMDDEDEDVTEDTKDVKKVKEEEEEDLGPDGSQDLLVPDEEIQQEYDLVWEKEEEGETGGGTDEDEKSELSDESEELSDKSSEKESIESDTHVTTYQLAPNVQFVPTQVQEILDFAVPLYFSGIKYDPDLCVKMCRKLSSYVLRKVYRLRMDRRKIIVIVRCHEKNWQSERAIYRFLWDQHSDGHANFTLDLQDMIISAIVLVLYVD